MRRGAQLATGAAAVAVLLAGTVAGAAMSHTVEAPVAVALGGLEAPHDATCTSSGDVATVDWTRDDSFAGAQIERTDARHGSVTGVVALNSTASSSISTSTTPAIFEGLTLMIGEPIRSETE